MTVNFFHTLFASSNIMWEMKAIERFKVPLPIKLSGAQILILAYCVYSQLKTSLGQSEDLMTNQLPFTCKGSNFITTEEGKEEIQKKMLLEQV